VPLRSLQQSWLFLRLPG